MSTSNPGGALRPNARPTFRVLAVIALIIAALAALDWFLENAEQREISAQAQRLYANSSRFLAEGKADQAVGLLRRAHALSRRNWDYELGLISALMAAGKLREAGPLMDEILQRDPNSGEANLVAARLMVRTGRISDAVSYYHRSVFGEWPETATARRLAARLELINFLAAQGRQKELLSELIALEEEAGNDISVQKRIAHLFLAAGSPGHAADVYQSLVHQGPADAESWFGLGQAELERGNYRAAQAAFLTAYRHKPNDPRIRNQMELSSTMTSLDPTPRKLRSLEKYLRSVRILELTRASLQKCIASHPAAASNETRTMLEAVPVKTPDHVSNELAESRLTQAEHVWQARLKACSANVSPEEQPLRLIMEKLAQ